MLAGKGHKTSAVSGQYPQDLIRLLEGYWRVTGELLQVFKVPIYNGSKTLWQNLIFYFSIVLYVILESLYI